MNEPILTFNAKSVSCEKLEQTLIGRKLVVDRLFNEISEKILKGETYQGLIVAQRGSGKTHIIKVIHCRLMSSKTLRSKIRVAYMIEDEYGISSFIHLIIQVLSSIIRYAETGSESIEKAIKEISLLPNQNQEAALKTLLNNYLEEKLLIVLIENFDKILEGMGAESSKLRDFIHEHNNISLVATSQSLSQSLTNSKFPFYQFFNVQRLEKLSFEESIELIKALAEVEEEPQIKKELIYELNNNQGDIKAKIRAIYELTYGNHRLLVHFFTFLKADLKSELSVVFTKQMNDLKSYYEQFVKNLSVQQQRIVQMLSMNRKPMKGSEIAQIGFLTPNVVSKQTSELFKNGFLDKHRSGKDVFYELREPLMRICFEINENPGGISSLFVNFIKMIYETREIRKKFMYYFYSARIQNEEMRTKLSKEAKMYEEVIKDFPSKIKKWEQFLTQSKIEELETKIDIVLEEQSEDVINLKKLISQAQYNLALDIVKSKIDGNSNNYIYYILEVLIYLITHRPNDAIRSLEKAIEIVPNSVGGITGDLMDEIVVSILGSYEFIDSEKFLQKIYKISIENNFSDMFFSSFPKAIFPLLVYSGDSPSKKLDALQTTLTSLFSFEKKMILPLKYLDVGIRKFTKGENNAELDLSKEERKVFDYFVTHPRERNAIYEEKSNFALWD